MKQIHNIYETRKTLKIHEIYLNYVTVFNTLTNGNMGFSVCCLKTILFAT